MSVQGEERHLVHEAAYQYLLSRIGEHLDLKRRPRLHALGLVGGQGAVAVMLPSGGGKSTLALRALEAPGVKLLSEDTPLIDRRGRLHPFPLRIGINATDADRVPADHVRRIERMEFHPKLVLELGALRRPHRGRARSRSATSWWAGARSAPRQGSSHSRAAAPRRCCCARR